LECRYEAPKSLARFIAFLDLGFTPAAHHKLLISALEAIERGDVRRLMVLMPPGSAKSTYASQLFPPWYIGRNPKHSLIGVSNKTELAEKWSRRARNILVRPEFRQVFGFGVNEQVSAVGSWENERGGEYHAAGMGAAIAGRRADLAIIDDPVSSREDADSEHIREKHWDWYTNDFLTRLKPGARQILIQTRWHEDDLGGRILEREADDWHVIKLPMEATTADPLGRQPGERLWPEHFTEEQVNKAKLDVRSWNALYQQEPAPDTGAFFKRGDFQEYIALPSPLHLYGASDYAVTEDGGDYTEHGIFGLDFNGDLYLVDWWRDQAPSNEWIEAQCDLIAKHQPLCWFGEKGSIQKAVEPFLKRRMNERMTLCRLEWLPSITDKATRARAIQARVSMGKVYVPKSAPWLADVMGQLLRFPAGRYDDAVDVCSLIGRGLEFTQVPPSAKKPVIPAFVSTHGRYGWMA
jgi:predicted phage terminase large subunit-like protein